MRQFARVVFKSVCLFGVIVESPDLAADVFYWAAFVFQREKRPFGTAQTIDRLLLLFMVKSVGTELGVKIVILIERVYKLIVCSLYRIVVDRLGAFVDLQHETICKSCFKVCVSLRSHR